MTAKTEHNLFFNDVIGSGDTDLKLSPIIPNGKRVTLKVFGGCTPQINNDDTPIIVVQWGSGTTWQSIRAGCKMFNFELNRDFLGDGVKRFRLIRENGHVTGSNIIIAWLDLLVHDER